MRNFILLGVIILLNSGKLFSQLNEGDTIKFQLRGAVGGNYQKGNVHLLIVYGKLDFSVRATKNVVFKSQNSSLYQSFYATKADNDIFSRNYLYWKPARTVYPFAIAYVSTNFRRKVDVRAFGGLGLTLQVINQKKHSLKVSAGSIYEQSNFTASTFNYSKFNGSKKMSLARATTYVGGWHRILGDKLKIYYNAYWQPAFDDNVNYRWQGDVGLEFPVWRGLSVNALYIYTHENVAINKIKQEDQILTFGLSYNFKTNG
ncbi:MAG: DUF481 domain-containing protein [Bacteroidota bacterium]